MSRAAMLLAAVALALPACGREPQLAPAGQPKLLIGQSPNSPLEVSYVKTEKGPGTAQWTGSVSGDITGGLATEVLSVRVAGAIWHLNTRWDVDAGAHSFTAELDGTLNTRTGTLLLTGRIVSGAFTGARIHDEGQLTGIDAGTGGTVFEGSLRIMTPSAN